MIPFNISSNSPSPRPFATVLIVDDTPMNLRLAADLLEFEGYKVWRAESAVEALSLLERELPDLVLVDIQMPEIDGLMLTRQLRSTPVFERLPIVALTAYAMKGDEEKARAAGCDGYITKPIDTRLFAGQIAEALRKGRSEK